MRRDVLPLVPWLLLGTVAGLFTAWVERELIGAKGQAFEFTPLQRILLAGRAVWFYLGKLAWPSDLIFIYERWHVDPRAAGQWAFPIAAVALVVALWLIRKRTRAPLAAVLIFVGTLFPVLGFFNVYPFVYSFVADHFQYQASLAIIALASAGITLGIRRLPEMWPTIGRACAGALVFVLGTLSFAQSGMYSDIVELYQTTIDRNPSCWMAHMNLGTLLQNDPETMDVAQAHLEEALRINPTLAEARQNLGTIYQQKGQYAQAIDQWTRAAETLRDEPGPLSNLAMLYATCPDPGVRNPAQAVQLARKAVDISHQQNAQAWAVLGAAYAEVGQIPSAIEATSTALKLARDANNKDMADRIEAHLAHYRELEQTPATPPAAAP
jgi:tetratricopeptide (TPR) repeat protein